MNTNHLLIQTMNPASSENENEPELYYAVSISDEGWIKDVTDGVASFSKDINDALRIPKSESNKFPKTLPQYKAFFFTPVPFLKRTKEETEELQAFIKQVCNYNRGWLRGMISTGEQSDFSKVADDAEAVIESLQRMIHTIKTGEYDAII